MAMVSIDMGVCGNCLLLCMDREFSIDFKNEIAIAVNVVAWLDAVANVVDAVFSRFGYP